MEEQRQQIVTTALELFKKYGIKSVSIDDISHQMSMSKKTFYQYFPGKDQLVEAVLKHMRESIQEVAYKYMTDKSAVECIKMLLEMHDKVSDVHKEPPFFFDLQKYYPQLYKDHVKSIHLITKTILVQHLQQGIAEGVYRSDLDVEMCAVMYSLIQQAYVKNDTAIQSVSPKRLIRFMMESFFRSIVSEEGRKQITDKYNIIKV